MMSQEDVSNARAALAAAIEKGMDTTDAITSLLYTNVPFVSKFQLLDFCDLLENNAQSAASLKRLIQALSILEKYARHLMKPAESRSNMWRHIKYSNNIFRERVNSVQGGRYVMSLMGYTENRQDGVAFPDGVEPNHERILNLLTDLVIGRKELEIYLEKQHPCPEEIEQYLTPQLRASLEGENSSEGMIPGSQNEMQSVNPSSTPASVQYQHSLGPPAGTAQPAAHHLPQFSQLTSQSLGSRQQMAGSDPTQISQFAEPNLLSRLEGNQHNSNYDNTPYVQNLASRQNTELKGQIQYQGMAQQGQGDHASISRQGQGQYAGIVQQGQAVGFNRQNLGIDISTNQKYLETQHRPNDLEQSAQNVDSPKESEGKTLSIACDICGDNHAVLICRICDNKQLCKGCDIKWHNHPKRQNHKLEYLLPAAKEKSYIPHRGEQQSPEFGMQGATGASPGSMYRTQQDPSRQSQARYSSHGGVPVQQMNQIQPNLDLPQDQYKNHNQYNMIGRNSDITPPSPAHSDQLNTHLPGSFMYAQPSMMGMPGTMHYPVSSGMMQHGQPVPYVSPTMIQGPVAQYPVSYMYMHHQQPPHMSMQGYITPVGTAGADMQRHQSSRAATLPRSGSAQSTPAAPVVVQNVRQAIPSPRVSEPPSISGMSPESTSSTSSTGSELLPGILAISNLEKRHSKLEISIMTLKDDLQEWEERINAIILQNPNFFQDEEYKNLCRKKRKHLQEKSELQKYQTELEKLLSEKVERDKMEEFEAREREVETLRRRYRKMHASDSHDQQQVPAVPDISDQSKQPLYIVPVSKEEGTSQRASTSISSGSSTGLVPAGPVTTTYRPQEILKPQPPAGQNLQEENCPPLHLNSLGDDLPEDIKKMLVLDQSPFAPAPYVLNDKLAVQVTSTEKAQDMMHGARNKSEIKKGNSEPDLVKGQTEQMMQMKKSQSSSDLPMWQCEHCTFLNEYADKACTMCFKTSDNPKRIGPNMPTVTEEYPGGGKKEETCEYCTVFLESGTKICQVCGKTQTKYQHLEATMSVVEGRQDVQAEAENQLVDMRQRAENQLVDMRQRAENQLVDMRQRAENQSMTAAAGAASNAVAASNVGKLIEEEQDQVYLEKKAARERFEQMNKSQVESAAKGGEINDTYSGGQERVVSGVQEGATSLPKETKFDVENLKQDVVQEWIVVEQSPKGESGQGKPNQLQAAPTNRDLEKIQHNSGSSGSYNSASSSLDAKEKAAGHAAGSGKATKAPQLNFVEAIEQINLKREQEQMSLDGHEVMTILKEGERAGYEVEEIHIALKHSVEDKLRPLDWLQTKWVKMIEDVAKTATEKGKGLERNDVGDISNMEAKQAMIECGGEIDKAVEKCLEDRKAKYAEVSKRGQYAREFVLTALFQKHGDLEEAVDQLDQSVVQSFTERLWKTNENRARDAEIAAASRVADLGNSVSNSVINHTGFQKLVSDTTIEKDRRVRMVFVEGKLKSWGRAEMVVTILDKEVTESENPLECTLEDIIEAVRNCGDKRSSLIYLTQECGICYSKYPMSKIRDLGVCHCKLCQDCVKQNFEVVIREKHVRNWCCPQCEAPGLEDESRAASYFEFLSLILQNLVSKEVMELYEIKLRDWHLQKDPNFRWCAHCASGFIWDRPDILGMACPSCHRKTCFLCKIQWEEQHEGLTCEEFSQWKIDNDPEKQAKGVKLYLEENGIDCPSCKMRYSLAKGGCMHFKCPQCGYEFCSGCSQAFLHQETCRLLKSCKGKGLHCHHPRDCFYYLRDCDPADLQKLLKDNRVVYNTEVPATQEDKNHCTVMEQKEFGPLKKDEPCGKDAKKGMAGLCEDHYKEYLVGLINKNKIDPVTMMNINQMKILIERNEKEVPKIKQNEAEGQYRRRVMQFIKERWQLHR